VYSGADSRTCLMIKNIPNKCVKQDILNDINFNNFNGFYDFFYLIPDLTVNNIKLTCILYRVNATKDTRLSTSLTQVP
jgi:hypothetical protein